MLYVHLNGLILLVAVQICDKVFNKIESVADNYERELLSQSRLNQEVLDLFWVIVV